MTTSASRNDDEIASLHLLMQLLQTVDAGLILINADHQVQLWNSFVENHSGIRSGDARNRDLFALFPELPEQWLKQKIASVFKLQSRAYCTWEQQPRLFNFRSSRPLTGKSEYMFQNVILIPLAGLTGEISQVCIMIYDVTDIATNKMELEAANHALAILGRTDRLTGLFNRGHFEEQLEREFFRCKRSGGATSLLMFDIDHFKQINDTYGHQAGDVVIQSLADLVQRTKRETDLAARYGGEEFIVILPDTTSVQAAVLANRLRANLAKSLMEHEGIVLEVTISIGISQYHDTLERPHQWLQETDQALYRSKHEGRNRVSIFNQAMP